MFEPGWILIWFHWESSRKHKTIQSSPAQTHSHLIWDAKLPYILQSDNKFFSISNFHGGYIYVWAGLNPDWFHWGSSSGLKTIQSSPAQTHSHFLWDAKLPYNHCSNKRNFSISNFHGGYKYVWAGLIPDCFIDDRLGDTKQFNPARLRPIPIFYGTPNFPIFCVQTINSSPTQTSMAATNMFEPGWILIGFIEDRLGDTKQFNPARLRPIPIFYGTPNFPIIIVQTINSSSTQTSMAATNMFEPGWILIGFIEDRLGDTKQFKSSPAQTNSHFLWDAKLPYNHCSNTKFFFNSNFHGGYKYVWAGLNPDWFHWGSSRGHKTIQSSPAQTHSHFLWDAKLPYILVQTINSSPTQTSMAATNMFEPGWILIGFIEDRLGDTNNSNQPGSDPFPFSMGRQTSLFSLFKQ